MALTKQQRLEHAAAIETAIFSGPMSMAGSAMTLPDVHFRAAPTLPSLQGPMTGNSFIIVVNGQAEQLADEATVEDAQARAEALAHKFQSDVVILKPFRKVAPVRNVVTTDL